MQPVLSLAEGDKWGGSVFDYTETENLSERCGDEGCVDSGGDDAKQSEWW